MHRYRRLVLLALTMSTPAAEAHHSISGVYDSRERTTVTGIVTEFRFVPPHAFLIISVEDDSAEPELWQLEMDNRFELVQIGMTEHTFATGDEVVAIGYPARTEAHRLYLRRLDRPADGFRYEQIGSRPRISAGRDEDGVR